MTVVTDARQVIQFVWTHPANRDRRVRQLARALTFQVAARTFGRRAVADVGRRGGRIWVDLHRTSATKVLYANPPDWPHMMIWERHLRPGDLFVDVGANVGTYAVLAASLGAEVIAIEAAADTAGLLRENIALNGYAINVVEQAVGAERGTIRFSVGRDSVNRVDPDGPVVVPVTTLDDVLGDRPVAGLKLDIEGYELAALQGAERLLGDRRARLIQLEWNACADRKPIVDFLSSHGYGLFEAERNGSLTPYRGWKTEDLFAAPSGLTDA